MTRTMLTSLLFVLAFNAFGQTKTDKTEFNFGFEKVTPGQKLPDGWIQEGMNCDYKTDNLTMHSGRNAMLFQLKGTIGYGILSYKIPAYEGKEIEMRVYIKGKDVKGTENAAYLQIDGALGQLKYQQMPKENIQGTFDWTSYSIKLPIPEDAKTIIIGAFISGTGQLWVDDFEILIDGKDISHAKQKQIKDLNADIDNEFDKGSKVEDFKPNEEKITDLKILGMIWGFLKYYHPNVAAGNFNWDYELFRILPKIIQSRTSQERDDILTDWIKSLGSFNVASKPIGVNSDIKVSPDLDWITNSNFSAGLSSELEKVRNAERKTENYYIYLWESGVPEFLKENAYPNMKYPDSGFRLLSLYRYWNVIQYYFPYRNLIGEDWKDVLMEFLPKFINANNELEYKLAVLELIARIHDSHAGINWQDTTLRNYYGKRLTPIKVSFIQNEAVVTDFFDQEFGEKSGLRIGDVISKINNEPVDSIVLEKLKYTSASNYPTQLRNIAYLLLRTNDTILKIEIIRNGLSESREIKSYSKLNTAKYHLKDTCFKLITPDIAYLNARNIEKEYLPLIMSEIKNTKGLIIDIRRSLSDGAWDLGEYLWPDSIAYAKLTKGNLLEPGTFIFEEPRKVGKKNTDYYKGKVIILVNSETQSAMETHAMVFSFAPKAKVIGSTTAGADGVVTWIDLPGGIRTTFTGTGLYYPDGRDVQRIGIIPDIEVKPTIEGIRLGKDEVLEKAIEIINKK